MTQSAQTQQTQSPPVPQTRSSPYPIEDFYRNTQLRGIAFSPDGKKILVSSDQSGIWNAYVVPVTGGPLQPLTSSRENSVFTLSYFPADERFLYFSDEGGNELTHIYVQTPDGKTIDVTPGPKLKANFHGWSADRRTFFVSTNERDARYFDVYEIAVADYAKTLLYRNTDGYALGAISRDRRYIALVKPRTTSDADIFLHDRTRNTTTNVTPHTGHVGNAPADFSPDGSRLLFLSDEGREYTSLRALDISAKTAATVYQEPWDIMGATYSDSGKHLVVTVNEDSRQVTRVLDAATFRSISSSGLTAQQAIRPLTISRDDSTIAFYATDGSGPNELFAGKIGAAPLRLTDTLNPNIRRADLVTPSIVRFKSYDGVEIPGLLYRPHQASRDHRVPALVSVHGGPGGQSQVRYSALTQALVNHGYAVYEINNRGSSGYGKTFYAMDDRKHGDADLGDVVASKGMLETTGYIDPSRIGIIGGSYGGYMVLAALTLRPDAFQAGVDLFGISNWPRTLLSMPPWWGAVRDALIAEIGDPETDAARLRRISPLFNADRIRAPLMVLQGANDPRVLKIESDEIVAAAKKNGVAVEYIVFPDEGHGFVKKENEIKGYGAVLAFLDRYLKGARKQP
jgi:dipeptidyl aminopeptidase/acylaminoacyl peptidase